MKLQSTPLSQRLWAFFFPESGKIDIHEPLINKIEKITVKRFRLTAWLVLSICLIFLLRSTRANFDLVFDIGKSSFILCWLYFSLIVQDRWINQNSLAKTMNISLRLKYYVEAAYEIALSVQVPVSVFGLLSVLKEDNSGRFGNGLYNSAADSSIELITLTIPLICLLLDFACNSYRFNYHRMILLFLYLLPHLSLVLLYSSKIDGLNHSHTTFTITLSLVCILSMFLTNRLAGWVCSRWKKNESDQEAKKLVAPPKLVQLKSARAMNDAGQDNSRPDIVHFQKKEDLSE